MSLNYDLSCSQQELFHLAGHTVQELPILSLILKMKKPTTIEAGRTRRRLPLSLVSGVHQVLTSQYGGTQSPSAGHPPREQPQEIRVPLGHTRLLSCHFCVFIHSFSTTFLFFLWSSVSVLPFLSLKETQGQVCSSIPPADVKVTVWPSTLTRTVGRLGCSLKSALVTKVEGRRNKRPRQVKSGLLQQPLTDYTPDYSVRAWRGDKSEANRVLLLRMEGW